MFETGIIVGLVFLGLVSLTFIIAAVIFFTVLKPTDTVTGWFVCSAFALIIAAAVAALTLFPFQPKYWVWETKEGVVAKTEFDGMSKTSGGGLQIELGDGTMFFTKDFRLAEKSPGEKVKLVCKPTFQHGNVDRIDCKSQIGSL